MGFGRKRTTTAPPTTDPLEVQPEPEPLLVSDEGIAIEQPDADTLINRTNPADNLFDARRLALHIAGVTYQHVAEAQDGAWIYRRDR